MTATAPARQKPAIKLDQTTEEQANAMENEGPSPPPPVPPEGTPVRSSLDKTMSDQDIDTAGTDAEKP